MQLANTQMSFSKDVEKITLNLSGYAENMVRATLFSLSYRIIKESPVDTGRFRGNWQASVSTPKVTQLKRKDRTGTTTINSVNNVLEKFSMGQTFYLTNNLTYARRLEYGY
ncbi:MAG TPA: HK97 gp10 family phage protein, partial [Pseudomonadales bacterium]|nr:HK97 gp10 family phage protein [Pseudomonadales bacterium]